MLDVMARSLLRMAELEEAEVNLVAVTGMSFGEAKRLGQLFGLSGLKMARDLASMGETTESLETLLRLGITAETVYWFRTIGHQYFRQAGSVRLMVGDISCRNNARSPEMRCAINPCGPCEGCNDFETWE